MASASARALLKDAPILLMAGRTVIAIAHRLSTITHMGRILYMEAGRIREAGSDAELLRRNGGYAAM